MLCRLLRFVFGCFKKVLFEQKPKPTAAENTVNVTDTRAIAVDQRNSTAHSRPSESTIKIFRNAQKDNYIVNHADILNTSRATMLKNQINIEIDLDLAVFNRLDEVYISYIKKTPYYVAAIPIKQQDKLLAFQIISRFALLKKLFISTKLNKSRRKESLVTHCIASVLKEQDFYIPTALNSLIDCYGGYSYGGFTTRIKRPVYTINSIAADIVRLCASHSTLGNRIIDSQERDYLKSLNVDKVHFLDRQSVYALRDQASTSLEALYKCKIVVNMVSGVIKKSMSAHESENEIVLSYPRLATDFSISQMVLSYKRWLQELSPRFPDFKNLVLAGAVYISKTEWYFPENVNTPVSLLVPGLDTKGFVFTPQDILDFFKWKTVNCRDPNSSFQKLLHGAFELCKSHVFKGMIRCQKTSFSTVGNSAQLVTYNWNQKELASFDGKTIYCDLLPQAKSEIMGTVEQGSTANMAHMFGIANEVKYLPMYEGTLNHDVQQARIAFLSQDFLPEYLSN